MGSVGLLLPESNKRTIYWEVKKKSEREDVESQIVERLRLGEFFMSGIFRGK